MKKIDRQVILRVNFGIVPILLAAIIGVHAIYGFIGAIIMMYVSMPLANLWHKVAEREK